MITAREAIALTQESMLRIAYVNIREAANAGRSMTLLDMDDYVIDELQKNGFVIKGTRVVSWSPE